MRSSPSLSACSGSPRKTSTVCGASGERHRLGDQLRIRLAVEGEAGGEAHLAGIGRQGADRVEGVVDPGRE